MALSLPWAFLLFLSCKDDASLVGFRKDPRLLTRYVEIPLDYSVYLNEPILTQNIADDGISRLLVGQVNDPDLGKTVATAYFNFSPPVQPTYPSEDATFVQLDLILKFDWYCFGSTDSTDLHLEVHELTEQLTPQRLYYNGTIIPYNPTPVGNIIFALGPQQLKNGWALATDSDPANNEYFGQSVRLDDGLGQRLLDAFNDRLLIEDFTQFSNEFKGFAVTMPISDKILGFSPIYSLPAPSGDDSRLQLVYRDGGVNYTIDFPIYYATVNNILQPVVSFTNISQDRTGTPVDGILGFKDLVPTDGKIYAQSGTGIQPKLDLTKVYQYFDTVDHPVINSAELVLDNTYTGRSAPQTIELLLLDSTNQYRGIYADTVVNGVDIKINDPYIIRIGNSISPYQVSADETRVAIINALTNATINVSQVNGKVGPVIISEFFQQIINYKDSKLRARALSIHPMDTEFKKSVSALKLNGSSATLRIYYSTPTTGIP